jgi:hypothetical protein
MTVPPRAPGLRAILIYKFVRAPIILALAVWLTIDPSSAHRSLEGVARELSEGGATWARAGAWIHAHVTGHLLVAGAVLAWLDGITTAIEGFLLRSGKAWAEWLVIFSLGALLPIEIVSLDRRPGVGKLSVLVLNALIVAYLTRRRVLAARAAHRSADGHGPRLTPS